MGSFNIAEAIKAGYDFLFHNIRLIVRLGTLPVLVKFLSYIAVASLGMEANLLREGLIMFPATMLEGYLVCTLLRLALFPQETLLQPPGAKAYDHYRMRAQDILAGAVLYGLLKLVAIFIVGVIAPMNVENTSTLPEAEANAEMFLGAILLIVFMMWAFRLLWLYIPMTCGYTIREYLKKVRGFSFSFHIFSVWLLSMLPFYLILAFLASLFIAITGHSVDNPSDLFKFLMFGVQAVLEIVMAIVISIGIGYGTMLVLTGRNTIHKGK